MSSPDSVARLLQSLSSKLIVELDRRALWLRASGARSNRAASVKNADKSALHQTRVTLRKMRSLIKAYKQFLSPEFVNDISAQLKNLSVQTNQIRDLEVQSAWLESTLENVEQAHRKVLSSTLSHWKREVKRRSVKFSSNWATKVRLVARRITRELSDAITAEAQVTSAQEWFVKTSRKSLRGLVKLLRRLDCNEDDQIHRCRLKVKKVRYFFEPALDATESPVRGSVEKTIKVLKDLQDYLGALHDMELLNEKLHSRHPEVFQRQARQSLITIVEAERKLLRDKLERFTRKQARALDYIHDKQHKRLKGRSFNLPLKVSRMPKASSAHMPLL